ncbi:DUF2970 domain-containing protein [uncultured Halopseudomonas sp.]|jgi:hypothetical protein|uniref:DUF2970 domain-containing protein n=1 Tax=uncultured Halopseudomonas sp. TaxID=2901193 RepID=UPI0030EF7F41|tara:strand:+ start:15803 stop:16039 length:237 start_codon:yes stop_codon:yes gene_type:complete
MSTGEQQDQKKEEAGMTFGQMFMSVLAAALGVQSSKARQRDFTKGKPSHFIILGIGFTLAFVLIIVGVVKLVLHLAGI